jgi:hypothetical protein
MWIHEAARRTEEIEQLSSRAGQLERTVESRFGALDARIDDFDVRPAGRRAMGAVLVICGSALMFAAQFAAV